jgi:DNA-binding beta-propeller fold protein YncE
MSRAWRLAWLVGTADLLVASRATALMITLNNPAPIPVGKPQTFALAGAIAAQGAVHTHWDFGDGTSGDATDFTVRHTYAEVGHYTVIVKASDAVGSAYANVVQTVHHPLPAVAPRVSSSVVIDVRRQQVWNVNPDSGSVSVTSAASGRRLAEIPVGSEPRALAQAPDGSVWIACRLSDEIAIVEPDRRAVKGRIPLRYASQPRGLAFSPDGHTAYVSLFATGQLVAIDVRSREVKATITLGPTPAGVSVATDGRIFVTRFISPADHGEVWVIRPHTLTLKRTIVLAFDASPDSQTNGRGVPNYVASFAISPDGTQAWVVAEKANVARGPMRDGQHMSSESFVRSIVCVVDLATEEEIAGKRLDLDNRNMPVAVAFSPTGDYGYVVLETNNEISFHDAYTLTNLGAIRDVGRAPDGAALAKDGKLWVNAFLSRELIAYDLTPSVTSIDQTAPSALYRTRTVDKEPLPETVLRGKQLFYNAADPRMDRVGYMSCASCHLDGADDGRTWDLTDRGEGLRNTKSLLGVRGALGEGKIHWTANMDEIQDFERDIRESMEGFGFMPDSEYEGRKAPDGHYDTLGRPAAGVSPDLDALAAYVTSLDKVPPSPFRNPNGSFTASALRGRRVFARAGCPDCHSAPEFTDSPAGLLHDVGTIDAKAGSRLDRPLVGFDTPTLKGAWATAPYFHDGRAATLQDVVTTYNVGDKMGVTSNLSSHQLQDLVEYLEELDDVPEPVAPTHPRTSLRKGDGRTGHVPGARSAHAGPRDQLTEPLWRTISPPPGDVP